MFRVATNPRLIATLTVRSMLVIENDSALNTQVQAPEWYSGWMIAVAISAMGTGSFVRRHFLGAQKRSGLKQIQNGFDSKRTNQRRNIRRLESIHKVAQLVCFTTDTRQMPNTINSCPITARKEESMVLAVATNLAIRWLTMASCIRRDSGLEFTSRTASESPLRSWLPQAWFELLIAHLQVGAVNTKRLFDPIDSLMVRLEHLAPLLAHEPIEIRPCSTLLSDSALQVGPWERVQNTISMAEYRIEGVLLSAQRCACHAGNRRTKLRCLNRVASAFENFVPICLMGTNFDQRPVFVEKSSLENEFQARCKMCDGKLLLILQLTSGAFDEVETIGHQRIEHLLFLLCCNHSSSPEHGSHQKGTL